MSSTRSTASVAATAVARASIPSYSARYEEESNLKWNVSPFVDAPLQDALPRPPKEQAERKNQMLKRPTSMSKKKGRKKSILVPHFGGSCERPDSIVREGDVRGRGLAPVPS